MGGGSFYTEISRENSGFKTCQNVMGAGVCEAQGFVQPFCGTDTHCLPLCGMRVCFEETRQILFTYRLISVSLLKLKTNGKEAVCEGNRFEKSY